MSYNISRRSNACAVLFKYPSREMIPLSTVTKRKTRDSIFVDLFSDIENVRRLYKELYPEDDDITADDIEICTLSTIIVSAVFNDLGFIVKDRFIVLVEAQTTWNPNMTLRFLFYLAEIYRRYLEANKKSEHSPKKLKLPKPELYIIYSGEEKRPGEMSFSEDYFGGDCCVDIRVKVITGIDDTLAGQYVGFCRVFKEQSKIYKNSIECAKETIRICKEKGYLAEYLSKHEKEVIDMVSYLFDEEYQRKMYDEAMREEYREEFKEEIAKEREESRASAIESVIKNLRVMGLSEEQIQQAVRLSN